MDRYQQFAIVAAGEAIEDAGLHLASRKPYRCGVIIGSGMGGLQTLEDGMARSCGQRAQKGLILYDSKVVINLLRGFCPSNTDSKDPISV